MSGSKHTVARGGAMFSTARPPVSKETQELLKVMMQESRLTNFQQRQLSERVKTGDSLPLSCNPTTSDTGQKRPHKIQSKKSSKTQSMQGIRTRDTINKLTDPEPDYIPPPPKYNSTVEKARLQNVMAFGEEGEPVKQSVCRTAAPVEEEVDRFDEVVQEIAERKEFLSEMEALGQQHKYKNQIMTEISQKIHELELLDKKRTIELESQLNS